MRFKQTIPFVVILVLLLSAGCGDKIEPGTTAVKPARTVQAQVAVAKLTSHPIHYTAVGTVTAQTSSTVAAKLMGTVTAVFVREGDMVQPGALLAEIDDRQITAQYRQAEAALAEARQAEATALSARDAATAGAVLARATYSRYQRLVEEDSVSRQEFDEVEARRNQAEAAIKQAESQVEAVRRRIQQAEAALAAVEVSRKDAKVLSPYHATVTSKQVEVGDLAAPGKPLFILEKAGGLRVDAVIPEAHIKAVHLDQKLLVSLPSLQSLTLEGTVQTIVPAADPQSRSFIVQIRLPESEAVRSGLFARVAVPLEESVMLLIPETAVVTQGQLTGVFLVDAEKIARFRLIRTGRKIDESFEVLSGLPEGSRYVLVPPPTLEDGMLVEVVS